MANRARSHVVHCEAGREPLVHRRGN